MPTMTVKGMPIELYERLKQSAAHHRRSMNSEIIVCIERALRSRRLASEEILARVARLRSTEDYPPLTDDFLAEAKRTGRP